MAGDSKADSVHLAHDFPTESLVCYTFMKQTEYGHGEFPSGERSISVFFYAKVDHAE